MFLAGWVWKIVQRLYLRLFFKPVLAEYYRFLETNGFLVVYLKPKYGLRLNWEVLVSSHFDSAEKDRTSKTVEFLQEKRIKLVQKDFRTTKEFIDYARNHYVLKENPWIRADLDTPEMRDLVKDFY